jgi:FkbM family methyltransferase
MSWRTNRFVVALRDVGRSLGLNKALASIYQEDRYEGAYDAELSRQIRAGDIVWDVGANQGLYTRMFSKRVGAAGAVYAFEPSPMNFRALSRGCANLENVFLLEVALGNLDGRIGFQQGVDGLGATSRIEPEGTLNQVEMRSGDALVDQRIATLPNAIKIDVEGFEWEVLSGIGRLLKNPEVRVIGVEIHFGLLTARGMGVVPQKVETMLGALGFSLTWPDHSHIIALRDS